MKYDKLYKYLDVNGALAMITDKNLQFTNPYYLNDPYDCNPGLFDYEVPDGYTMGWADKDFIQKKAKIDSFNVRRETWVCSLSRRNDNMLMWSYYTGHKGVCVGLKNELAVSTMTKRSLGQ